MWWNGHFTDEFWQSYWNRGRNLLFRKKNKLHVPLVTSYSCFDSDSFHLEEFPLILWPFFSTRRFPKLVRRYLYISPLPRLSAFLMILATLTKHAQQMNPSIHNRWWGWWLLVVRIMWHESPWQHTIQRTLLVTKCALWQCGSGTSWWWVCRHRAGQ